MGDSIVGRVLARIAALVRWPSDQKPNRKNCGCECEPTRSVHPPDATLVGRESYTSTSERPACTIREEVLVRVYRCWECGEEFCVDTGAPISREVRFADGETIEADTRNQEKVGATLPLERTSGPGRFDP